METWAYCEGCRRWFYVTEPGDDIRLAHACPACEAISQQVVQAHSGGRFR